MAYRRRLFSSDGGSSPSKDNPSTLPMQRDTNLSTAVACGAMASCVALSNFLVQFPVGWIGTWGTAVFPVCFLITDLTNRFNGAAAARKVVYAGFVSQLVSARAHAASELGIR